MVLIIIIIIIIIIIGFVGKNVRYEITCYYYEFFNNILILTYSVVW